MGWDEMEMGSLINCCGLTSEVQPPYFRPLSAAPLGGVEIGKRRHALHDEAMLRDIMRKLHPEELKFLFRMARRRWRRRPERLKIKSLRVEAETARGLKPMLTSQGPAEFIVHGHNPERVTLGSIGNLDFYCYPNLWSDRAFIGLYPNSVQVERADLSKLISVAMRTFWAIKSGMNTKRIKEISTFKKSIKRFKTAKNRIKGKWGQKNVANK